MYSFLNSGFYSGLGMPVQCRDKVHESCIVYSSGRSSHSSNDSAQELNTCSQKQSRRVGCLRVTSWRAFFQREGKTIFRKKTRFLVKWCILWKFRRGKSHFQLLGGASAYWWIIFQMIYICIRSSTRWFHLALVKTRRSSRLPINARHSYWLSSLRHILNQRSPWSHESSVTLEYSLIS